ncbi:MAG TPA: dTDP-4-dehydrorhamnose reductase [Anaerolineales bacterium]|nr:dTDP-4-dehydrorhamnose reductase [Anaerolineales bacterium]
MRLFITGINGQLGSELASRASAAHEVSGGDLPDFDITQLDQARAIITAARPDVVLHCAAMTDVDGAARQPDLAFQINGLGTQNVALACAALNISMLYVSSNEVFDGTKSKPYHEFDATQPANPYGYSKLAGEWFTQRLLNRFYIVRTSWLTGSAGRNFVHRILQLADERRSLRVVTDEEASPTFVPDLVDAILKLIVTRRYGIYHFVNSGHCSRYGFAKRILELAGRQDVPIEPITLADYPRPSVPPKFTPLANVCGAAIGITLRSWEEALEEFLKLSGQGDSEKGG